MQQEHFFVLSDFICKHLCVKIHLRINILNSRESKKKDTTKMIKLLDTNRLTYFHFMQKQQHKKNEILLVDIYIFKKKKIKSLPRSLSQL